MQRPHAFLFLAAFLLSIPTTAVAAASATAHECATLSSVASREFKELSLSEDPKWQEIDRQALRNDSEPTLAIGNQVALLIRDHRSPGGERVVYGYIYSITKRELHTISVSDLTRAERRELGWQGLWRTGSRVTAFDWTVHITTVPPLYETVNSTGVANLSARWVAEPHPRTMTSIKLQNVEAAKLAL